MQQLHNELKKEFQVERMILFSDAVFAIAITLLAIEIKVPVLEGEHITDKELLHALAHTGFNFIGFLISFFIIGLYWTVHHRMFSYVDNYDQRLLWRNLFFLLSIVLMPFSSGLYGEYSRHIELITPYAVYVFNICLTGFFNYRLWKYIGDPKNKIAHEALTTHTLKLGIARCWIAPMLFVVSLTFAFFASWSVWFPVAGRYLPMFMPVFIKRAKSYYDKKYPEG